MATQLGNVDHDNMAFGCTCSHLSRYQAEEELFEPINVANLSDI